ncbi:MAG: hypothetical protein U9Q39_05010 [Pseudomonadota bacterium]|nr:hypothetical protein [Pseudomonadota bacterium]
MTKEDDLEKIRMITCGAFHSQGFQVLRTFEGPCKDVRQVAVVCLWSQNMQCLAQKMLGEACQKVLANRKNQKRVKEQLLSDESELIGMSGVKAFIDEHGKFVLCAFGQAPLSASNPEKSASGRATEKSG